MAKNRITYSEELVLRDGKVGIGTSAPSSELDVLGDVVVQGGVVLSSVGSTEGELITQKHYRDNGGSIAYESGDKHLFSVSNEGDFAYVINDEDGNPILEIENDGSTTLDGNISISDNVSIGSSLSVGTTASIPSVKTQEVSFVSTGNTITAKHYEDNNGSLAFQSGDKHLFSVSNEGDFAYVINNDDGTPILEIENDGSTTLNGNISISDNVSNPALTVANSGVTTIRDLFQNTVNFTSVGSSIGENIQVNHYRNIAYQPAIGNTFNNQGAISFDSLTGITTDGVTYFPASLFALTNGGGNIFSVSGYNWYSGSPGIPAIDVTPQSRIGIGTTNPLYDIHIVNRNIFASDSSVTTKEITSSGIVTSQSAHVESIKVGDRIDFTDSPNPVQNTFIKLETRNSQISPALVGGASVFSGTNASPFNGGQLVTVENNDKTYFRININVLTPVSIAGTGTTFLPPGEAAIIPAIDVNKYGEVRIYDTKTKPGDTFNPLPTGISTIAPNDSDLFRIDSYSTPFIGTFPTIRPAIRVNKFGYTEISRNVNQIAGITTVGISTTTTSLSVNATMTFELTDNNTLTVKVRGTDGVTRSGIVTLS